MPQVFGLGGRVAEWITPDEVDDFAFGRDDELGLERKTLLKLGAQRRLADPGADHQRSRRADVDHIEFSHLFGEHTGTERLMSAHVRRSQEYNQCHRFAAYALRKAKLRQAPSDAAPTLAAAASVRDSFMDAGFVGADDGVHYIGALVINDDVRNAGDVVLLHEIAMFIDVNLLQDDVRIALRNLLQDRADFSARAAPIGVEIDNRY